MVKLLSNKRIVALLLALTLICTMFSSLSLVMPMAQAADEGTYVIHAVGKSDATLGRAFFINVPANKVVAGETYTASVTVQGVNPNNQNARILVKNGSASTATKIGDSNGDTLTNTYSGAYVWTETITMPETIDATGIYIGLRLNAGNFKTLNTYFGAVQLIDKDGKNIVPALTASTVIYGAAGPDHTIQGNEVANWSTLQSEKVEDVADATLKQTLFNNFYTGKSMLHLTGRGAKTFQVAHYKRIPASKLKANTTYNLSIKYDGYNAYDTSYNYILIRQGAGTSAVLSSGTTGQFSNDGFCKLYTAQYTTPATPEDLYIGFNIQDSKWNDNNAELYIGDMQFVESGKTENLFTPLSDTTDLYCSYTGKAAVKFTPSNGQTFKKVKLDANKFDPSADVIAMHKTNVIYIDGKDDAATGVAAFLKIPAANITANETYTVKLIVQGKAVNNTDSSGLMVRQGATANSPELARQGYTNPGTKATTYSDATVWTAQITPTAAEDLYVGIRMNKDNTRSANFYMGGLQLIDKDGNNVAPEITSSTVVYNTTSPNGTIFKMDSATLANYVTTQEVMSLSSVTDDAARQTLFNNFYIGDSVLHLEKGSANEQHVIYKRIPASKLKANTTYKLTIKYDGFTFDEYRYILIRDSSADHAPNLLTSATAGTFTQNATYSQYEAEYTTPVTLSTEGLFIGIYLNKSGWSTAKLEIGEMKLVEKGKTENLVTPLSDMTDLYKGYNDRTIAKYDTTDIVVTCAKKALDTEKYPPEIPAEVNLVHVDGKDDAALGVATFVRIPAANIIAGKTYTANITVYGKPLHGADSELLVRAGAANNSTILARTGSGDNKGTVTAPYANTVCWTVDVTPATATDLYIGIRLNKANTQNADFYIGNVELIDENGNNVAPQPITAADVFNAPGATHTISQFAPDVLAQYLTALEIVDIETAPDAVKQAFSKDNNEGGGESGDEPEENYEGYMLFMTSGTANESHTIYKKIPADKLTAGKKYALSIKYAGASLNNYDFIVMRDNIAVGGANIMTSVDSGENVNCGEYYKFDYEYTAPATPTDLYIGIYLRSTAWKDAEVLIGEMEFVEEGKTENLFTPLGDMRDLYNGYNGKSINPYNPETNTVVKVERRALDSVKFADVLPPDPSEAANKMAHIKGVGGGNVAWVYKKVENVPAGKYVASYLHNGTAMNDKILFNVKTDNATLIETYQGGYKEGKVSGGYHEIVLTETSNVYVGYKIAMSVIKTVDMNVANLGLQPLKADGSLGENLVTPVGNTTDWINNRSNGTKDKIFFDADGHANPHNSNPAVYTIDMVNKDKSLFPEPDYMLHIKDNADNDDSFVTEIPANKLTAGKEYTVSFDSNFLSNALNKDAYFAIFGGENASNWTEVIYGSAQVGFAFESVKTNGARTEYTFTLDEKKFEKYYVGFYFAESNTPIELYFANLKIYETADTTKTNLLPDTGNDMTKWYNNVGAGSADALGETKAVKYDRYNATQMVKAGIKQKTMLHITRETNTAAETRLKIDKSIIKPNTDYVFSFKYKNLTAEEDSDSMGARFVVFADNNPESASRPGNKYLFSNGGSGTPFGDMLTDGVNGYFVFNISSKTYDEYTNYYAGWSYGAGTDIYIADFVMYELSDPDKKNLLCKDEYSTDMSSWYNYSRDPLASELYDFFGASYIPYDDTLFKREIAVSGSYNAGDRIVHKLDKSKISAGREITVNLNYYLGGLKLDEDVSVVIFGDSNKNDNVYADTLLFGANAKAYSRIINGKSNREYFFEFTKEMLNKYDDIYVGLYFNKKAENVDIHFANLVVTEFGATEPIFKQHRSEARVTGWCTGTEKLSVTKLSKDIKTMFYNGRQYPVYVFEELDDGEWWTEEAVKPIEVKGDATVKGTIYGVDGKPLKNIKLRLVSDEISYEVTTNSKGEFVFANIQEGFYQMFRVEKNGDLIDLEYGITVDRGSVITLKIEMADVYDNEEYIDGDIIGSDDEAEDVGSVRGNVYTAQLKVVKGLKMYLRGVGETVTDKNGYFEFVDVPVGTYELYTVLANGEEYIFKKVEIKKNIDIQTKLKYDPATTANADSESNILWIIIIAVAGLLIIGTGATVTVLVIKAKKKQK